MPRCSRRWTCRRKTGAELDAANLISELKRRRVFRYLGAQNSRMKDFYDIWLLARQFEFKGRTLAAAVLATFSNRGTAIDLTPIALTPTFTESPTTRTQWTAFRKKAGLLHAPERLADVVTFLS